MYKTNQIRETKQVTLDEYPLGPVYILGPNLVSWCSRKQQLVTRSSTKAEYRSMVNTTAELLYPILTLSCRFPFALPLSSSVTLTHTTPSFMRGPNLWS